ncbi:hypothetical protein OEA41_002104 [Lepraria neglecta]|uniref:Major facilitator superfamily (MFS) profile domain-containing protein n=1 Tax=Lepraria neglecta TaxID=209136 RepID=A0AAE0DPM8_9LECA|nr:hypothetical protein OEA41_002104 [Lepraria neglecta]
MDQVSDSEKVASTMTSEVKPEKNASLTADIDSDEQNLSQASKTEGLFSLQRQELEGNLVDLHTYSLDFLLIFEVASVVQAAAPSSVAFIVGRVLSGIGGSGVLAGSLTIFSEEIPKAKLPYVMGAFGWVHSIGGIAGPVIGGAWDYKSSLKEVLVKFDYPGIAVFAAAVVALLLGLQFGGSSYSWSDGRTIASLTIAGVLFLISAAIESWKGSDAIVPGKIIGNRVVSLSSIYTSTLDGAYFILTYQISLWFQSISGLSARDSVGSGVLTTLRPGASAVNWVIGEVLAGAGTGFGNSLPLLAVQDTLSPGDVPIGYAVVLTAGYLGSSVALAISQAVFAGRLKRNIRLQLQGVDSDVIINAGATDLRN